MCVAIPGQSWDDQSIPGIPGYSDRGGGELGPTRDDGQSIPGIPGYSERRGELCPSWDDPGMVGVSRESQDTHTGGSELCPSRDDPGMVEVSQEVHV